VKANN